METGPLISLLCSLETEVCLNIAHNHVASMQEVEELQDIMANAYMDMEVEAEGSWVREPGPPGPWVVRGVCF